MPIAITLNGERREIAEQTSVAALLAELELESDRNAVERNGRIVRRGEQTRVELERGDVVEIVTLVGGG